VSSRLSSVEPSTDSTAKVFPESVRRFERTREKSARMN
jgi:hypothetical protein